MNILSTVKFIALILVWYFSGAFYLSIAQFKQKAYLKRALVNTTLNIITGLSVFLLLTHLCSYITHSYNLSLRIFFPITILIAIYSLFKEKDKLVIAIKKFTIPDLIWFAISLYFSTVYFRIDAFKTGSWDRAHHAMIETILSNNIYPPAAIASKEHIVDYYHYGIDLVAASISKFCSLRAWDALSLQLGLTGFFCLLTLYCLINFFIRSQVLSILLSLFVFAYSSFNHIHFFIDNIQNYSKFRPQELFTAFFIFSQPALKNFSQRLHFYGQSMGFLLTFILLYVQFHFIWISKETVKKNGIYVLLTLSSFILYFNYPSMWYPVVAGYICYLSLDFLDSLRKTPIVTAIKISVASVISVIAIFLGKFLTFTKSLSHYEGINLFPFSPKTYFNLPEPWLKPYMKYFMSPGEFTADKFEIEAFNFSRDLKVDIFSQITFREFGFIAIIAFGLFLFTWIRDKKFNPSFVLFFSGIISCLVPYLFEYILRPHEELRFFVFGKTILLLFIVISAFQKARSIKSLFLSWRIFIPILMILMCLANLITLSMQIPMISKNLLVNGPQREFVRLMKTVLKSGDVCIDDDKPFANAAPLGSLAGCYGVGYRLLRENTIRKKTAFNTMDPNLLKDLDVNYVIITQPKKLSLKAQKHLMDQRMFTRLFENSKLPWLIFRFNKDLDYDIPHDYMWTIGIESPNGFRLVKNNQGKIIYSADKEPLEKIAREIRTKAAATNNYSEAIWLDIMPVPKEMKDRNQIGIKNQSK